MVWLPMLRGDVREKAHAATEDDADGVDHVWWDAARTLGKAWAPTLHLPAASVAWDVYLVFGPEARWDAAPPAPTTWWHQLQGGPPAQRAGKTLADDLAQAAESLLPASLNR